MIDREDSPVHHPAAKPDRPRSRGQHRTSRAGCQIHAAVPGQPALGRLIKPADNLRFGSQRPLPGRDRCSICGSHARARRPQCSAGSKDCRGQHQNTGSQSGRRSGRTGRQRTGNRRNTHASSPRPGAQLRGTGPSEVDARSPGSEAPAAVEEERPEGLRRCSTLDEAVCCALILPAQPGKFPPAATGAGEPPGKSGWEQEDAPQADYACSNYPLFPQGKRGCVPAVRSTPERYTRQLPVPGRRLMGTRSSTRRVLLLTVNRQLFPRAPSTACCRKE